MLLFCASAFAQNDKSVPMAKVTPQLPVTVPADKVLLQSVIRDAKGETLPGANVYVRETKGGAVADLEGQFSLTLPKGKAVTVDRTGREELK